MYDVAAMISALVDFLESQTQYNWRVYKNRDSVTIERLLNHHLHRVHVDYQPVKLGDGIHVVRGSFSKACPPRKFSDYADPNLLSNISTTVDQYLTK